MLDDYRITAKSRQYSIKVAGQLDTCGSVPGGQEVIFCKRSGPLLGPLSLHWVTG
jgi:hypothetical protein